MKYRHVQRVRNRSSINKAHRNEQRSNVHTHSILGGSFGCVIMVCSTLLVLLFSYSPFFILLASNVLFDST